MMALRSIFYLLVLGQVLLADSPPVSSDSVLLNLCANDTIPCIVSQKFPSVMLNDKYSYIIQIALPTTWAEDFKVKNVTLKSKEITILNGMTFTDDYFSKEDSKRWTVEYRVSSRRPNITCLEITLTVKNVQLSDEFWSHWEFFVNNTLYRTEGAIFFDVPKLTAWTPIPSLSPDDMFTTTNADPFTTPESHQTTPLFNDLDGNEHQKAILEHQKAILEHQKASLEHEKAILDKLSLMIGLIISGFVIVLPKSGIKDILMKMWNKLKEWIQQIMASHSSSTDPEHREESTQQDQTRPFSRPISQCEAPDEGDEGDGTNGERQHQPGAQTWLSIESEGLEGDTNETEPGPSAPIITEGRKDEAQEEQDDQDQGDQAQQDQQMPHTQSEDEFLVEDCDQGANSLKELNSSCFINDTLHTAQGDIKSKPLELGVLETDESNPQQQEQSPLLRKQTTSFTITSS